ncbi:MAG: hypothetical protein JXB49_14280 [Bacteroidales bacterium]|nr:hypothetical protein [Bacteroidales bacterium]
MSSTKKTGKDYRKEYNELKKEQVALEARMRKRLETLCKLHPDIPIGTISTASDLLQYSYNVQKLSIDGVLMYIDRIEIELAKKNKYKQTEIDFRIDPQQIDSHEFCNCDGRDMPTYVEEGKRWCPQCGLQVK